MSQFDVNLNIYKTETLNDFTYSQTNPSISGTVDITTEPSNQVTNIGIYK